MTEATLPILVGVAQGWLLIPLAFYVGLLVSRDLCRRYAHLHVFSCFVVPLTVTALWLAMGYISANHVLDIIAASKNGRELWLVGGFFGLMGYAITVVLVKRRPAPPEQESSQHT